MYIPSSLKFYYKSVSNTQECINDYITITYQPSLHNKML